MSIRYRSITEEDLEDWYDHVGSVFTRAGRQYFVNHYRNDPWAFAAGVLVAEDASIVSTVRVFDRRLFIRGREVRTGGIGEVSTKPAYRRQGHSGHLLTMASELMVRQGMPLSLLFADRFGHYGRYGWRQIKLPVVTAVPRSGRTSGHNGLSVRPLAFDADRDLMMTEYAELNHRLNGPIVRDCRDYWDRWVRCEIGDQGVAFIADGLPVGFGRFCTHGEMLTIGDLGILAAHTQLLPSFLHAAAAGRPLVIHTALHRHLHDGFDGLFDIAPLAPHLDQMFKLIDGTRFLGTVFGGVATRLPDGSVIRLGYESGTTDIRSTDGQLLVSAADAEPPGMTVGLTDAQLLALVLVGWERLGETGVERPAVTEPVAALLSELFAPAGWLFWEEDAF